MWHFIPFFQLKEKKEKFEKEQAKKKDDFKSGRIVGKVRCADNFWTQLAGDVVSVHPCTPKISFVILIAVHHRIGMMLVWKILGIWSTNNPPTDIFLNSCPLCVSYCTDM